MKRFIRFASAMLAVLFTGALWADIQVDNVAALSGLRVNGDGYARVQFRLDDQRFTVTGANALEDVVWVKSIGVVQRPDNTIALNSTLRIQQSTGEDTNTGISSAQNGAVIAISQPLSSSTETLTVGTASQTLRTYTFAAPFPLKKSTLYTASFYNASGTAENQQIAMYNDSTNQTTQNKNTTIHASADANFSPCVRIIAVERSKLADVEASANWSGLWGEVPTETDTVGLNVKAANATLTMDTSATVSGLAIGSETAVGPLTLTGTGSLTSTTTTIATDTNVSAITASLGEVTVASGKKLTVGVNTSASNWALGGSTLATKGDFETPEAVWGALIASTAANRPAKLLVESGTLALKANISTDAINYAVEVAPGATLDINGVYDTCPTSLTLGEKATLCNGGNDTSTSKIQWTNLVLDGDATLSGNTFASLARNWASQSLTLGGNTLTVEMNENKTFYLSSAGARLSESDTTSEAGTVKVTSGTLSLYSDKNADSLKRANVVLAGGTLLVEGKGLLGSLAGESGTLNLSNDPNKDVPIGHLNDDTTFAGTVSGSGIFHKVGTGTQTLSGDLSGFSGTYQVDDGTLEVVNATDKTLSNTISGSGTVKKSGAGTLSLTGTVSTPVKLAEGTLNLGTSRPAVTVTGAGTTLKLTLTPDEALTGRTVLETTLGDGVTSYTLEVSFCGTKKSATKSASGVVTFPAYAAITTGNSWWWDYEFNGNVDNAGSDTTGLTKDGADPTYTTDDNNTATTDDDTTALNLSSTPHRTATYPAEFTAVMYAKAGSNKYGGLLAFGTKSGGAISLVCGADPANGQVRLIYSKESTVTELISAEAMSVPNATTANHLYAFTKRIENGNTVIDVYLDGRKLAHYAFSGAATIGGGFQVGSLHGGAITGALEKATSGTVDFLRVSNTALSDEAIAVLAAEYSYTSPNGKATRTVTNADTAWSSEGAWTEGERTVAAPTAGKVVELTASADASLAVALDADVSYESLKLSGEGTVALTRGEGTTGRIVVQGVTTVETDTTVDARAVKLTGLAIAEGKRLTIDCSGLVLLQDTYRLTGYIDAATFQRIVVTLPSEEADTPFTFEATHDSTTGFVVLRANAVKDLAATVSTNTAWADVRWTWAGHDTPTALQTTTIDNATLTFENNAAISTPAALTVTGTLTASGAGSLDLPTGSTVATTQLSGSATLILHQSQANVVTTRSGTGGTFKFVGGTTADPLMVNQTVVFPGAIAVAADSCINIYYTGPSNASYQVTGAGQSSTVILTSDHGWGVLNEANSVTSFFRDLTLSIGGDCNFWIRAGLTDNVWLEIPTGRTVTQEADAPGTTDGVLTVRNLTGGGTFTTSKENKTLCLLNTDPAASTFNAAPTITDGKTNFKLVFAGKWTVGAALTDAKTPPIIHIGDGTTETMVETAVAFAPVAAYTVQANATLRPTAAAAALPASLTLAEGRKLAEGDKLVEGGKVQLTLDSLTLPSALSGKGSVLFGNGTDTFAYTLAAAPANFTGTYNVAANSTLTLTSAPNEGAGFAGSGTLVIGNGTAATNVTSTKAYADEAQQLTVQVKSPSTLTLNPGSGNFAFPNAVAFDVASGAKLVLASGMSFFGVSGDGSCSVTGNYLFGVSGSSFPDAAKKLNIATLTVGTDTNAAVTLSVRPFGAIEIAPTTLKVNKNAVIARDSNTSATADASVSFGENAIVTGEGTIELPVAFANGAVLDTVTAAPLLLKGKVTGLIKVKLNTAKAVLSTTSDVEFDRNTLLAFASDDASQEFAREGYRFAETVFGITHTFAVVPPLTLPGSLPEAVSGNAAAQDAIYDAVAAIGSNITSVTAVTAQSTGGVTGNVEALALFKNLHALATIGEQLGDGTNPLTVTVYYDFGISQLHVKRASLVDAEDARLYVLLCAKVATSGTISADYATGTIVTLYKGDTPVNTALTPTDEQLEALGITREAGERWFAVPLEGLGVGTSAFTVSASPKTTP